MVSLTIIVAVSIVFVLIVLGCGVSRKALSLQYVDPLSGFETFNGVSRGRKIRKIAETCYQVNKAYCNAIGDNSQVDWDGISKERQDSTISRVNYYLSNKNNKIGMKLDERLPVVQKAKEYIFKAICDSLSSGLE